MTLNLIANLYIVMLIEVFIEEDVLAKLEIIAANNARSLEEEITSLCKQGVSKHDDNAFGLL